jgi:hypothetical protein
MTSTCLTCKFWNIHGSAHECFTEANDFEGEPAPHRKCLFVIHGNLDGEHAQKMLETPAAVLDGSGYAASLWTKAEFGCLGWVQR